MTGSYLQDPAYYAAFLGGLKPASQLAVTVIAGPETSTIATGAITEPFQQSLALLPSCTTDGSSTLPDRATGVAARSVQELARRCGELLQHLHDRRLQRDGGRGRHRSHRAAPMSRHLVALALCGCFETAAPPQVTPDAGAPAVQPTNRLDVLFVVDDSPSTLDKEQKLASAVAQLGDMFGLFAGFPDLHVGLRSSASPRRARRPVGRVRDRDWLRRLDARPRPAGHARPRPRVPIDCSMSTGRAYRNFEGTIADALACIAPADETGCTYEAPLEAMKRALDGSHPENAGFLRPDQRCSS